jgi:Alpha/beta hydrolase family
MKKSILVLALLALFGILLLILVPAFSLRANRDFTPVTIPAGDYSLQGYLSKGSDPEGPYVIFFHGNRPEGQAHPLYQHILQMFPPEMTVLGVDVLGYGQSKVDPTVDPEKILVFQDDWRAAANYLQENLGARKDQIVLAGHSMGATIVMDAARKDEFLLSIPIGLGDWKVVLDSPQLARDHAVKLKAHTGVSVTPEQLRRYKAEYQPQVVFGSCPQTPVRLVFARHDDGPATMGENIKEAKEKCGPLVDWRTIPISDHTYGTEVTRFPKPVNELYSNISLTFLKWQLLRLIQQAES